MSNELATTNTESLPAELMEEFEQHSGEGMENADASSFAKPILKLLQKNSHAVDEDSDSYIEGAKAGKILETASQTVYSAVQVIPVYYDRHFYEWTPMDEEGGIVQTYDAAEGEKLSEQGTKNGGSFVLPNGNELVDTREYYVILIRPDGSYEPAYLPMSSTNIKHSRKWNTHINNLKVTSSSGKKISPPMYALMYTLDTKYESSTKHSWYEFNVNYDGLIQDKELFREAESFRQTLKTQNEAPMNQDDMEGEI